MLEPPFNKILGLKACNFIKKRLQHRCYPVKFAKFLKTSILRTIASVNCPEPALGRFSSKKLF